MTQADHDLIRILVDKGFSPTMADALTSNITEAINGSDQSFIRLLGESLIDLSNLYPQGTGHLRQ